MAGIGFQLRDAVDPAAGLMARTRAWTAACLISSGPWIATVCVLTYLQVLSPMTVEQGEHDLFRALVTWCFAFSLLVVAVAQMPLSRQLADQLWLGEHERLLPGYVSALAVTGVIQVALGGYFAAAMGLTPLASILGVGLYVACTWTWLSLIWLGVTRNYTSVLVAYTVGGGLTVVLSLVLRFESGLEGLLCVFGAGQALTLVLLAKAVLRGLRGSHERALGALDGVRRFPTLVAIGALYGVGMWADKFVFWAVDGVSVRGPLVHHPLYDSCSFLAYATVVPALAIHLVRTETSFYEQYRLYFDTVGNGGTYREIVEARERMLSTLRQSVYRLIRLQAWFTALPIILAPEIMSRLGMPPGTVPVFRVLAIGAYFHVLFLLTMLVLLYFDRQMAALKAATAFCALNIVLPWVSAHGDPGAYGIGYALACLGGLVVGFFGLQSDLGRIEYLTFCRRQARA